MIGLTPLPWRNFVEFFRALHGKPKAIPLFRPVPPYTLDRMMSMFLRARSGFRCVFVCGGRAVFYLLFWA
jgi:hypothetical protein